MDISGLAPSDLLAYFSLPVETLFTGSLLGTQVAAPNSLRWGLIFSFTFGSSSCILSTKQVSGSSSGITVNTAAPVYSMTIHSHGILPMMGWFANSSTGGLTVIELLAPNMPSGLTGPMPAIDHPAPVFPTPVLPTSPGVNGDAGLLSYWSKLMDKVRGK